MPVRFLSEAHYRAYGQYTGLPSEVQLAQFFYLDEVDQDHIAMRRRNANRLGFALQLVTVRFLGTYIEDMTSIPHGVVTYVATQLEIDPNAVDLTKYNRNNIFFTHRYQINAHYGYRPFHDEEPSFQFLRWLYTRTWIGSERPSILFDLSTAWLIEQKILLPGVTTLERLVAQVRERAERRSWQRLNRVLTPDHRRKLEQLLATADEKDMPTLDDLRKKPTHTSSRQLKHMLQRLEDLEQHDCHTLDISSVSANRLHAMGNYALNVPMHTLRRLIPERRSAVTLAGIKLLHIHLRDTILDMFEQWTDDAIVQSKQSLREDRLRTLASYDQAAKYLRDMAQQVVEMSPDATVSDLFASFAADEIKAAIAVVDTVQRPQHQTYHGYLVGRYRSARYFLPQLLRLIAFQGVTEAGDLLAAIAFLRQLETTRQTNMQDAPRAVISSSWRPVVIGSDGVLQQPYTLCVLHELYQCLRKRDVFIAPSDRWHDPRQFLIDPKAWQRLRPQICRSLDRHPDAEIEMKKLSHQLDEAYRLTALAFETDDDLRFEKIDGHPRPVLSPLEAVPDPPGLHHLQQRLTQRLPAVDLPQLMLDVHQFTGFADAFTHLSRTQAHVNDFPVSLCAVLLARACNIGLDAVVNEQTEALTISRLRWVQENYIRPETLIAASDRLVNAQTQLTITLYWGGGEVASADGIRFVVPKHALHGRFNRKYFGTGRGVTFFNFMSDQFTGFHHVVIPGTLREALYILDGMLDHTTDLQPQTVMTDTNSYTDIVFGLFWLLGFQFSPRLADLKSMRFWRMDRQVDHGVFDAVAHSCISTQRIYGDWDDMLRVAGSLKTGTVTASNLMRIFSTTGGTSSLTRSIRDVGRIAKSLHMLHYLRDEAYRRRILTQLNHTEQRHKLARRVAYGNRGELKQTYREGQEEQLGALGLMLNLIVYWNTVYLDRALGELLQHGGHVDAEAISRITPLSYDHIRILGRYTFPFDPDDVAPIYRPLRPMNI